MKPIKPPSPITTELSRLSPETLAGCAANRTKHTPRPWSVETKGSKHFIAGADELTVSYLDRAGMRDRAEIDANAHLIAASPDLLAHAKTLLTWAETFQRISRIGDSGPLAADIEAARSAIAKAEGKTESRKMYCDFVPLGIGPALPPTSTP